MGVRADFYIGRGEQAEWLGSIRWAGSPEHIDKRILEAKDLEWYKAAIAEILATRDGFVWPSEGWPWPWGDSGTTDYTYAFDDGRVWASCAGSDWFDPLQPEPEHEIETEGELAGRTKQLAVFPNMADRKNRR
jgi:hypothetical protein